MGEKACPKCNGPMDEGHLNVEIGYVSEKQKGMMRRPTMINLIRACPTCGYVELFLNPAELRQRIS